MFPGLGADKRLFKYQKKSIPNLIVPSFIEPKPNESLNEYSQRYAESLTISENDIIGGMSFGGMLALEIAKIRECKAVILICANRRSKEISKQFRTQANLLKTLPETMVRLGLKTMGISTLKNREGLEVSDIETLEAMVEDMDFSFFKWSSIACSDWEYDFNPEDFSMPVYQIHGEKDSIITLPPEEESEFIKGAGHLINFTHAKELNQWILEKTAQ
jgi:pimeloyl-ACP methyl ester carboxylesterase